MEEESGAAPLKLFAAWKASTIDLQLYLLFFYPESQLLFSLARNSALTLKISFTLENTFWLFHQTWKSVL